MPSFRKPETTELYRENRKTDEFKHTCVLCEREPITGYKHWKLIENQFPYDLIAETHHMLLPYRHVAEHDLTVEEIAEFMEIKYSDAIQHHYDNFMESTHKTRSIPPHFHLHLLVLRDLTP